MVSATPSLSSVSGGPGGRLAPAAGRAFRGNSSGRGRRSGRGCRRSPPAGGCPAAPAGFLLQSLARLPPRAARPRAAILVLAALLSGPAASLAAEAVVGGEIGASATLRRGTEADSPGLFSLANGKLTVASRGSAEVKGQLTLDLKVADAVYLDVTKAWIKAKLDFLRVTAGKTHLSWGEGVMYNAAALLYGEGTVDLSAEDIRDDNRWLLALSAPLGDFSFVELVGLPPDLPLTALLRKAQAPDNPAVPAASLAGPDSSAGGGRFYTKLGETKLEGGWLYRGATRSNHPYLSLQGNLGLDWQLASSLALPADRAFAGDDGRSWQITGGLYWQTPVSAPAAQAPLPDAPAAEGLPPSGLPADAGPAADGAAEETAASLGTLALRLEARCFPLRDWTARGLPPAAAAATVFPADPARASPYALGLYPEITWRSDAWFVWLRAVVSPLDLSARTSLGLRWAPLQGLQLFATGSLDLGETGDVYAGDRPGAWQLAIGTRFVF